MGCLDWGRPKWEGPTMLHVKDHAAVRRHAGIFIILMAIFLEISYIGTGLSNAMATIFDSLPPGATMGGIWTLWSGLLAPAQVTNIAMALVSNVAIAALDLVKIPLCVAIFFAVRRLWKVVLSVAILGVMLIGFENFLRIQERVIDYQLSPVSVAQEERVAIERDLAEKARLLADSQGEAEIETEIHADYAAADRDVTTRRQRDLATLEERRSKTEARLWEQAPAAEPVALEALGTDLGALETAHRERLADLDDGLTVELAAIGDQRAAAHAANERWLEARRAALGPADDGQHRVQVAALNVRAGPGPSHPVVGSLHLGELVAVREFTGPWGRIEGEGEQRFVHSAYLIPVGGGADLAAIQSLLEAFDAKQAEIDAKHDSLVADARARHSAAQRIEIEGYDAARERLVGRQDTLRAARDAGVAERGAALASLARDFEARADTLTATADDELGAAATARDARLTKLAEYQVGEAALREEIAALEQARIEQDRTIAQLAAENQFVRIARRAFGHEDAADVSQEELTLVTGIWALSLAAIQALGPVALTFGGLVLLFQRTERELVERRERREGLLSRIVDAIRTRRKPMRTIYVPWPGGLVPEAVPKVHKPQGNGERADYHA